MFDSQSESLGQLKMLFSQLLTALAVLILIHLEVTPAQIDSLTLQALTAETLIIVS